MTFSRQELYDWLDKQILCVVATNGEVGYPNAAAVSFSQTDDLQFVIIADKDSRKVKNIARNDRVALTVTSEEDRYTLQLEGNAKPLTWDEFEKHSERHYKKLPFLRSLKAAPGQVPFLVTPIHMRFCDITVHPWEFTEIPVAV